MHETIDAAGQLVQSGCINYEKAGFRTLFCSPFEQYTQHVGKPFRVIRYMADKVLPLDEPEDMYLIEIDGQEIEAWGYEVCMHSRTDIDYLEGVTSRLQSRNLQNNR